LSTAINGLWFFKDVDGQAITVTTHHYTHMTKTFLMPKINMTDLQFVSEAGDSHFIDGPDLLVDHT
jgi:hypothetical protein